MGKNGHFPTAIDTAERVFQTGGAKFPVSKDLCVFYVLRGVIYNWHAYLFVGEPLKSGFLYSTDGGLTWQLGQFIGTDQGEKLLKYILRFLLMCVLTGPGVFAGSPRSQFIKTSDGVRIHYAEAGEGRAIVFIPGWRMPGWIWQKQIDELSKNYRVIAIDPRSQGESDKPAYGSLAISRFALPRRPMISNGS